MKSFDFGSDVYKNLKDLRSTIEVRANCLSSNQKLIVCALVKDSPNISQPVLGMFVSGLGFSGVPDLSSPALTAIREICGYGNSGQYSLEELQSRFTLLRILGQLDDMRTAVNFVCVLSDVLSSFDLEIRDYYVDSNSQRSS
jgi:hypothetical protein